jgi:cyclophilin family peptidyl-prolyl cis-trans isomerase
MKKIAISVLVLIVVILGVWFLVKDGKPKELDLANTNLENNVINNIEEKIENKEVQNINTNLKEENKVMNATFNTNKGNFTVELFDKKAPNTVANFTKLAGSGFYNGVKFHRVIKGFMIQGGDPLTKDDSKMTLWGTGGPGYAFADEIGTDNKNDVGTIAMANAGPNTNGSQFFVNVNANNFLDTKHTVFGKVTSGMEVVKIIENTQTDQNDRPTEAVVIQSIVLN